MDDSFFDKHISPFNSPGLLQSVINALPAGVEVLNPVIENGEVVDFLYVLVNNAARLQGDSLLKAGKSFLQTSNGNNRQFKQMVQVLTSGVTDNHIVAAEQEGILHWFKELYIKHEEGIIICRYDITPIKLDSEKEEENYKQFSSSNPRGNWLVASNSTEDARFISYLVDTTRDIIYILDLNTLQLIYSNRMVATALGYTRSQISLMSNPLFSIMHKDDVPRMMEHLKCMKTVRDDDRVVEIEYRLRNAKGGYNWFLDRNAVFKKNSRNIPVEGIGICQDITQRKQQEEEARTRLDILNQSEEIVSLGSWEYVIETREFKWSDGMYRLFNLDKDEPISPEIYLDYTSNQDRRKTKKVVNLISRKFQPFEETLSLLPPGKEEKIVKVKAAVQYDIHNRPVKVIGVDLDITNQVTAGKEIHELLQKLSSKNHELEIINKEIKTLNQVTARDYKEKLQQLYTNLEFIISNDAKQLSETGKANIRRAQSAIQRMNLLTDDINVYFNLYERKVEIDPESVNASLDKLVTKWQAKLDQCNGKLEVFALPQIAADPELFFQLINSLMDNAVKFRKVLIPPLIKIKHSRADELNAVEGARPNTPYDIISFTDNGLGFFETESEKIFDLFYRGENKTMSKGSGIGLAVCRKIMSMHGGFIRAEGSPAKGASFYCYFPMSFNGS